MKFDDTDKKILGYLQVDARSSARQLALKLGVSTLTVLTRIKKLEKEKIIKGYSARLDDEKLGYDLTAIIEIKAKPGKIIETENKIADHQNVISVYDVTGTTDMIVLAKFQNREELSIFVKKISSETCIDNTISHIVLNTIKEDFRVDVKVL